ncbi:Protein CBG27243 [Caenorhabditis briggsae]|uniref:Uncharacterized protein n=2 Tax=Caenorhabditis briggsae TaxID=6238 RepID=A0AAE9A4Q5_CAEBR|nr:Protein CBG27243 [Caenorhabditis briggsae]ULT91437.1 hypothetical protein L3Y34_009216 [Caenorhabditis briggsae]CAR98781.1 Protein CBG27243 [Caenorhabditis briggsae]
MDRMNKMDNKDFDIDHDPKMDKFRVDRKPEQLDTHFGRFDDLKKDMPRMQQEGKCCEKKKDMCCDEEPMDKRRESDVRNKEM